MNDRYPFVRQKHSYDCGPACLAMIFKYYNKCMELSEISFLAHTNYQGTNIINMCNLCKHMGVLAMAIKISKAAFYEDFTLPCIAQVCKGTNHHFVVIYEKNIFSVIIADPGCGIKKLHIINFLRCFSGTLILLEPVLKRL
ncbi:cysteine peptidase family C39 domain-containing protein [Lacrimispora sp.]|jgi:ATP-binding cassette subfamily B protein|uniref:cysteine peptidase family C39 domain-containing protein n=1 Tax=Lacrimispora sp. TaxID=2719234 RepID=UPI0029E6D474|nr:ATP-binding cassette, subfamily bacteriocin exporter [Lacrimispora sp.]